MPFIFANFNGTHHDIDVFTHEMGHAFQNFCSRDLPGFERCTLDMLHLGSNFGLSVSTEGASWASIGQAFTDRRA